MAIFNVLFIRYEMCLTSATYYNKTCVVDAGKKSYCIPICKLLYIYIYIDLHIYFLYMYIHILALFEFLTGVFYDNASRTGVVGSIGAANVNSWNDIPLDDLVEYYDSTITSLHDRLAPSRTKTFRIRPSNDWFDDDCKAAKQLSRTKERIYLKTKLPSDIKDWIKQLRDYHKLCASKSSLFLKCQMETGSSQGVINTPRGRKLIPNVCDIPSSMNISTPCHILNTPPPLRGETPLHFHISV